MVGIAFAGRGPYLDGKLQQLKIPWPQIAEPRGPGGAIPLLYGVRGVSTFILIDREGKILARGSRLGQMESLIETVLKSTAMVNRPAAARN